MSLPLPEPSLSPETKSEIQLNLKQLEISSKTLNLLSDQLSAEIAGIEAAINKFNLGIETAVEISSWSSEDGTWTQGWNLGYGKVSSKWGFVISYYDENINWPENATSEQWLFRDAPREQRVKAVEKVPLLLKALVKKSNDFSSDISRKLTLAKDLVSTVVPAKSDGSKK